MINMISCGDHSIGASISEIEKKQVYVLVIPIRKATLLPNNQMCQGG